MQIPNITTLISTAAADSEAKMPIKPIVPPITGDFLSSKDLLVILKKCVGLNLYWNCLEKAKIVKEYMGFGAVVLGECLVISKNGESAYGHYYLPPYEFHAWWQGRFSGEESNPTNNIIVDVALSGLIAKGLNTKDEIGPALVGREPIVLAGQPEQWMKYIPKIEM